LWRNESKYCSIVLLPDGRKWTSEWIAFNLKLVHLMSVWRWDELEQSNRDLRSRNGNTYRDRRQDHVAWP
jgi:hypothetical protein